MGTHRRTGFLIGAVLVLTSPGVGGAASNGTSLPVPIPRPHPVQETLPVRPDPPHSGQRDPVFAPAKAPALDQGCMARLKLRGVVVEPISIPVQPDPRCSVAEPVRLLGLKPAGGPTIAFPDMPTLACVTVDIFSAYVQDLLTPLAVGSFGSPIATVATGPGLECRTRDHIVGAKLSAHGQGLAVDIAGMALADGRKIAIGLPATDAERAFETAARAAGCGYFHTTLGPGSDAFHRTHWHFDLEPRGAKGDAKFCQ